MFFAVTLSLRTISVTRGSLSPSATDACVTQAGSTLLQHKVNDEFVHSLLLGLSLPRPDHITFSIRPQYLPTRILLFYFDDVQGRAVIKHKTINDTFYINSKYRRIIADFARASDTELRAFVQAAAIIKSMVKLRRGDLVTILILGDYRKAAAERTRIHALHTRLEAKTEKLQEEVRELGLIELKLANANAKVKTLEMKFKDQRRDSVGQKSSNGMKHRYPTRYSLTSNVIETEELQDEDS